MKKFMLLGICGVALAACGDSSTGLEETCLSIFKHEGIAIDTTIQKQCKCVEEKMVKQYGAKYTKQTADFINTQYTQGRAAAEKKYPSFDWHEAQDRFGEANFGEGGCDKITGYDPDAYGI